MFLCVFEDGTIINGPVCQAAKHVTQTRLAIIIAVAESHSLL